MKKIAIALFAILISSLHLHGQTAQEEDIQTYNRAVADYEESVNQMKRSELRLQKKEIIHKVLGLSSEQARAFWPVYDKHEVEVLRSNDSRLAIIAEYMNHRSDMSPEKASELINRVMQAQDERHELKRNYVKELGGVLTAKQALRLLLVENKLDLQIDAQIAAQIPLQ